MALDAFNEMWKFSRDLFVIQSRIKCLLLMNDVALALSVAKEAHSLYNNDPRVMTLFAHALSHHPHSDIKSKARQFLDAALRIDPKCFDAATGLVQININEQKYNEAIVLFAMPSPFIPFSSCSLFLATR